VSGTGSCPLLTRLLGSRIAVINAEMRIPLLGVSQYGLINFPYLPTEIAPFFDGGMAWTSTSHPVLTLNPNTTGDAPVFSAAQARASTSRLHCSRKSIMRFHSNALAWEASSGSRSFPAGNTQMVGNTSIDLGARRVIALGLVAVALAGANAARAQDVPPPHRSRFQYVIGNRDR